MVSDSSTIRQNFKNLLKENSCPSETETSKRGKEKAPKVKKVCENPKAYWNNQDDITDLVDIILEDSKLNKNNFQTRSCNAKNKNFMLKLFNS